jgi:ribokinase
VSRVIVLGSINMDLVVQVRALPLPGETVLGERLLTLDGGKGANQAVAAARLGATVRFIGRIGADAFGDRLLEGLDADRVDRTGVTRDPDQPSGVALIVVQAGGQNTVTVAPGANARVGAVELGRLAGEVQLGDVVVLQLEIPVEAVRAAAAAARAAGAVVILNAAPAGPLVGHPLPEVDVLVVNEAEAAALSGSAADNAETAEAAAAHLAGSARAVVVTLGVAGSILWQEGAAVRIAPLVVEALDATAAGDAFVGAVAFALSAGRSLEKAVELGSAAGALATTRVGARSSLPTAAELLP